MKKILVPTDFSPCANNAMNNAIILAKKSGSSIILLHAVPTTLEWDKLSDQEKENRPEILLKINQAKDEFGKIVIEHKEIDIHPVIKTGLHPSGVVLKYAEAESIDLIVLGTHGFNDSEQFIGSTAQKIQRGSDAPVLLLKLSHQIQRLNLIVFASNFEEEMKKPFAKLLVVANAIGARMQLLYVNTPAHFKDSHYSENLMEKFVANFPNEGLSRHIHNAQFVDKGILSYTKSINADFIALTTHGKRNIPSYLLGVTEMVSFHSDKPVVSINIQ